MRIGLVYDLRDDYRAMGYSEEQTVEFDSIDTVNGMAGALERLGHEVDRIGHGKKLAQRLVLGDHWDLVWSIAEGLKGRAREAQVPGLLELYDQPYAFSDCTTMALALDKALAKRVVRDSGIATAPFMQIETGNEDLAPWSHYPAFVKPLAEGTGKGCELASKVNTAAELMSAARALIHRFGQPALVEAYLPGREFTVGIVGNGARARVVGVMEIFLKQEADQGVYSMRNKEESEELCAYEAATDDVAKLVAKRGLAAYKALGCRDACRLDFRCDADGFPVFIEANPIAGLHPTHSDLPILSALNGISYDQLIGLILEAAMDRYSLAEAEARRIKRRKVG
jgi:D-alanine-D-alanine ligase